MPTAFICVCPPDPDDELPTDIEGCQAAFCEAIVGIVSPPAAGVIEFCCTETEPCIKFVVDGGIVTGVQVGGQTYNAE